MRILGIDPGLSITGYGIIEITDQGLVCLGYGGIKAPSASVFAEKLLAIHQRLKDVIEEYQPDFCAVEDIFYHRNKKTAIVMGHARAVAILAAAQQDIPVSEYSPREVKMAIVGYGAASKTQVQAMVKNILKMPEIASPADAADALAVALCHYHRIKFKQLTDGK